METILIGFRAYGFSGPCRDSGKHSAQDDDRV